MAFTLNRRLAQLVDSNGQLNTGKIPNDYITSDHVADNTITSAMLHTSFTVSTSNLTAIDTDDVSEGSTNLYYTNARARGAVSATGSLSYNSSTGVFSFTQGDTDTISEGSTNLYFTNARVDSHLSGGTGVTYSSGEISIGQDVSTSATPTFGNITTTGYIAGPATFTIDPAAVGDNTGTVVIAGNLQVDGTTTTINSTTVNVDDLNIQLATGAINAAAADGAGITVDGASATITYDGTNDEWDFNKDINVTGTITSGNITVTETAIFQDGDTDRTLLLGNDSGRGYIRFYRDNATAHGQIMHDGTNFTLSTTAGLVKVSDDLEVTGTVVADGLTVDTSTLVVDSTNNRVGIGTTNPNSPLEIVKNITFSSADTFPQLLIKTTATTTGNQLGLGVDETDNVAFIEAIDRGNNVIPLVLQRNAGRVGIGTDNPGFALTISNTTSGKLSLAGGTNQNGIRFEAAGNDGVSSSLYYLGVGSDLMSGTDYGAVLLDVTNNRSVLFDDQSTSRLGFYNNSMVIDSSGNVGIGTSSPSAPLDVAGNFIFKSPANTLYGNFDNTTAGYGAFRLQNQGSNYGFIGQTSSILASGGSNTALGLRSENEFAIATGGSTERMRIDSSGNVGIGTDSPTGSGKILHFNSSSNVADFHVTNSVTGATSTDGFILRVTDPADVEYINREGATTDQIWYQGSTRVMSIRASSGNVAIGSHNPASKLHILGPGGGVTTDLRICSPDNNTSRLTVAEDTTGDQHGAFFEYKGGDLDKTQIGVINNYTESNLIMFRDNTYAGFGSNLTNPLQNLVVGTTTNYDPPGLGNTNANFAILKRDSSSSGDYGIITGISNDGNVWSQVQRVDGVATGYNYYLQPSGGSVGIGVPQNHVYIPNLIYPLRVAKQRSGTGNVTDYLSKISIDGMGYGGSNYQMAALDFSGGNTAGKSGVDYGRIGCSSMNGANNQHEGSLEFYAKAPGFSMSGTTHAMKIHGQVNTSSAGGGTTRNGVLFTYQGLAIDRSWADYPCINVMNSTPYSSSSSTQSELRIHGNNVSSASYPGTSGSDFSVTVRSDGGYATGSDRRRKRNITTLTNALDTVKQLTGKRFQTVNRSEEVQEHVSKNGYKLGFIAQEVEDIIPEAVQYHADEDDGTGNWNSAYAMDYGSVVALLVNAIKEQDVVIQDLKSRIETLEG